MSKATNVRKISVKEVFGAIDIEQLIAAENKEQHVMDVYGVANGIKPGCNDLGPYVKFLGRFKAISGKTGEVFESAVLLLPKFLEEQLAAVVIVGDTTNQVDFAFRVRVRYDKDVVTKYIYIADSLVETKESAAMLSLEDRIRAYAQAQIEDKSKTAPKKDGKK